MSPLYAYSLLPVLAVALLHFFTAAFRSRGARGLALYCLSVAVWCAALLLASLPPTAEIGRHLAAIGAFIAATYLHAAYELVGERRYGLVIVAYVVALALTLLGVAIPGVLYDPMTLRAGPLFWPAMALAAGAAVIPLWRLAATYPRAEPTERAILRRLFIAGLLCDVGGMGNALLLSNGIQLPFGMLLVLAALLVLAGVVQARQPLSQRRLLERSMLYSALAAVLSAGYLLGVMALMTDQPLVREYRLGAFFLLSMAALAFEPVRQQIQEVIGRRLIKDRAPAADLAEALRVQEEKAEHAERLAELGTLASAVAHEVRNPLGVLAAHLKILEKRGADAETLAAMRTQIDRADRFIDDLLRFGRARPLEPRLFDLAAVAELSLSTAQQGFGPAPEGLVIERAFEQPGPLVEADQAQIGQLLVILFDNALLAVLERAAGARKISVAIRATSERAELVVEDSGPGIPSAIVDRLFQPFVTSRKREGARPGTGLGLATAQKIAERHGGRIHAGTSLALGGARFVVELPKHARLMDAPSAEEPAR
ncbi:MAG: sensor histidine kinase [Deltaproteobacteria bacterium]|nr:sensor histidine kinase [Deltaproteobacteria bacterium]